MRRFAITTIALLGLAAPGAALAQGAAQPPAPSSTQTPAQPAAPAAPAAADAPDASRSLFEPTAREFLIGGRFTSVDGDPARYQRYQDQRDGLLFSNFRYSFAKPDGTWDFHARAENVGYRDQEFMGSYNRIGKLSLSGSWQQIPQFYSVDTMTPYTGTGGTLVLDDATQRAIQNGAGQPQRLRPAGAGVRTARAARHRPFRPGRDAEAEPRRHGQLHDAEAQRRAALGGQLRLQQRRRGGAPLRFARERPHHRHRVDERAQHAACRLQRLLVRQHRADADLGQPAPPRRQADAGPGRGRMSLWPSNSAQTISFARLHQAGAQDAGDRLLLLRIVEQRRAAAALHDQRDAAAVRAAPRDHRGGSARLFDQPEPHLAPVDRLAVQRARAQLHLRQPHASDVHHGHGQLRRRGRRRRQRAVRTSTRTAGRPSTATPRGRN